MKIAPIVAFLLLIVFHSSLAQQGALSGTVTDAKTNEPLIGVTVSAGNNTGTVTDNNGKYELQLNEGKYSIELSYIGYERRIEHVTIVANENILLDVALKMILNELGLIVVSASKYEKNITEETVSMEVLKPDFIHNINCISLDDAIEKVPGVNMIDNQANIRGGSGFSYGAGSRVLMLVDDIPQLTADANDVKWEFLPIENVNQVEIIKGAASVLYGSSAMNGVINLRTAYPTSVPLTQVSAFQGLYQNPKDSNKVWWGNQQPYYSGASIFHSRKFGQFDLVLGSNFFNERSFRQGEYTLRGRINANTRYRFKKIDGLSLGINANFMNYHSGTYFLWEDDTSGAYVPLGGLDSATTTISEGSNTRWNADPFVAYFSKNGDHHSLKLRYFFTENSNNTNQSSTARLYYGEYQFSRHYNSGFTWVAGLSGNYSDVRADLYGDHSANNFAGFVQLEKKFFNKLTLVGGVRYETFRVDTVDGQSEPVLRTGLNYPIGQKTFLRVSFGQGYRFPSIAEKFIRTSIGSLVILPNPDVQPERGWSTEVGVKRSFGFSNWNGFIDLAVFYQRYRDLIQFTFGYYPPEPTPNVFYIEHLGFKSINIENASIAGAELSVIGEGSIGSVKTNLLAGITYIQPINLDQKEYADSVIDNSDALSAEVKDSLESTIILNYRFKTTAKFNVDMSYRKISWGAEFRYNSFMINLDPFFEGRDPLYQQLMLPPQSFMTGVKNFREEHSKGDYVIDLRLSYQLNNAIQVSFVCKNLLNREYSIRPALLDAPRSFVVQARIQL